MDARHIDEWHEDYGDVLWWHEGEPPWVGHPPCVGRMVVLQILGADDPLLSTHFNVGGWPGYHEWWTPLPEWPIRPARRAVASPETSHAN